VNQSDIIPNTQTPVADEIPSAAPSVAPNTVSNKDNNSSKAMIVVLGLLALVFVAVLSGIAGYMMGKNRGEGERSEGAKDTEIKKEVVISSTKVPDTKPDTSEDEVDPYEWWQLHEDDVYEFTIRYPEGWNAESPSNGSGGAVVRLYGKIDGIDIEIQIGPELATKQSGVTLEEYSLSGMKELYGDGAPEPVAKNTIELAGKDMFRIVNDSNFGEGQVVTYYFYDDSDEIFRISWDAENYEQKLDFIEKIIDSFKFV